MSIIEKIMQAVEGTVVEAEVDFPAGREAGPRIEYDSDELRNKVEAVVASPSKSAKTHGPFGWFIKPVGLAEDAWRLSVYPSDHPNEEVSVPLFTTDEQALGAPTAVAHVLDRPAKVGSIVFRAGVSHAVVVSANQRFFAESAKNDAPSPSKHVITSSVHGGLTVDVGKKLNLCLETFDGVLILAVDLQEPFSAAKPFNKNTVLNALLLDHGEELVAYRPAHINNQKSPHQILTISAAIASVGLISTPHTTTYPTVLTDDANSQLADEDALDKKEGSDNG